MQYVMVAHKTLRRMGFKQGIVGLYFRSREIFNTCMNMECFFSI